MIKKTITYSDYNGNSYTEDFYFNLSKGELIEMECGVKGGLTKKLEAISKSSDPTLIMPMFKEIILKSYGKKSDDGKRFIKSQEIVDEFVQSEAYSELMVELMRDENAASNFVNGLVNVKPEEIEAAKARANISALPRATSST